MERKKIILNLGSGEDYHQWQYNLDLHSLDADIKCDVRYLPIRDFCADVIEAHHIIEHLGYMGGIHLVSESFRVLKPNGTLSITTPDIESTFSWFLTAHSREEKEFAMNWIYGQEIPGYAHLWCYPKEALIEILERIGFTSIRVLQDRIDDLWPVWTVKCLKSENFQPFHFLTCIRNILPHELVDIADVTLQLDLEKKGLWRLLPDFKILLSSHDSRAMTRIITHLGEISPEVAKEIQTFCSKTLGFP